MQVIILSAGFGGQGVMVLGQLLGLAACEDGKEATFYPFYGPEQRGGTASCTTIIADKRIGTPVTATYDVFVALNKPSLLKFQGGVKVGGTIITNPETANDAEIRKDVKVIAIPMEEMAKQVGSPKVANLILLAVIGRYFNILSQKSLRNAVAYKLGKKKELLEMNLAAVQAGWEYEIDL